MRLVLSAILAMSLMLTQPAVVLAGFGVSPPEITEERAVAGSHIERTIYLVQGSPHSDLNIVVRVDSRDIKDWILFEQGTEFTIPEGVQQYPLKVAIDIPEDVELGIYKAFIRVNTIPVVSAEKTGKISIALGGRIDVEITVGDDVFVEFRVVNISILDIGEKDDPRVRLTIENTGNVPAAPIGASFELFDKFGNIRLAFIQVDESKFPRVPSFSTEEIELTFPIDVALAQGEYWGHVKIYDEDGSVVRQLRTVFNVRKGSLFGALTATGFAGAAAFFGGVTSGTLFFIGGIVLIIIVALASFLFGRRLSKGRGRKT